ncbi:MAG TPA: hypothetical protein VHF69_13640, partial [Candidatus Synoicihabitans sp.]|nr:hypothetical protein [Candidatus Synoicihabitans sp.]
LVNPTGELAGLWRGTANDVHRDINRNWHTTLVDPNENRGIDTVIIHKQAMTKDVAAIDLGQPYAVIDLHQNFGDQLPALHYVLHNRNPVAAAFVRRLQEQVDIADVLSNPPSKQTLRGYWQHHGAAMSLCIERSTYSTLGAEREFGRQLMRALAPATNAALVATTTTETLAPPAEDPATSDSTPLATLPLDSTAVYATHSTATETSTGSEGGNSHVHAVHHCEAEAETEAVSSPFSASDRIAAD